MCVIIMFLIKLFVVVYVEFYDDIELIVWIDGKYDDYYDSQFDIRYLIKMNMCNLYC